MNQAIRHSVKTVFRVDYQPSLDFFDKLYPTAQAFSDEYPKWSTNRLKVTLRDYDSRRSLLISHNAWIFSQDAFDSSTKEVKPIDRIMSELPDALGKSSFTRVGLRRKYLLPVEMEYDELVELFREKVLTSDPKFHTGISLGISDLSLILNFPPPGLTAVLIAPVYREQFSRVPQILELQLEDHFGPASERLGPSELFETYPHYSVYLDVDYSETNVEVSKLTEVYEAGCVAHVNFVENVHNYMFGV